MTVYTDINTRGEDGIARGHCQRSLLNVQRPREAQRRAPANVIGTTQLIGYLRGDFDITRCLIGEYY